jgi:ATP-dependent helicase/nuclease subunit A
VAEIQDAQARTLAATTFDRNVVVTAGAGTGKTTLLVDRLVHLVVKSPDPVPLPEIVALTFMIKAANEIKIRLQERLLDLAARPEAATDLLERYRLSSAELAARAEAAVLEVERSQIGTIHSFAAHLLRLYPVEAGVDPGFEPDEGVGFEEHFQREWERWLDDELGAGGSRHDVWRRVLRRIGVVELRELARALVKDLVPLDDLAEQVRDTSLSPPVRAWLQEKRDRANELSTAHLEEGKELRQVERLLAAARSVFDLILARGAPGIKAVDGDTAALLDDKSAGSKPPVGWDKRDFDEAVRITQTAKAVLRTDHEYFRDALAILGPFAECCRRRFLEAGAITFDGLLARARDLLRDHPGIRERLKRHFKAILVDEFQDTDPVQYEIILFLCERAGRPVADWQAVQMEPGKLFIVGDPKQSIFAFRRADIEAFQDVTERVLAQGGLPLTLTTNFRSHASILAVVNGLFGRLLAEGRGPQPPYHALDPQPDRKTGAGTQGVALRLVAPDGDDEESEDLNAPQAVRAEAEALARWLKTEVIGREVLTSRDGPPRKVEPGDVALLFRTFTQSRDYLEALRRHGLSYVAEGEKHFYRRQEVIDLVNLLRCVRHPDDQVALVGLLRSALGAFTDRELVELAALRALDYRGGVPPGLSRHPKAAHLRRLYEALESLHRDCPMKPLPDALDLVFARLPVLELASASLHGEQAAANLWKICDLAEDLAADPDMTLAGFVDLLAERIADPPEESESGLAEESLEAVRVLSIHKAKGLEFPIVVLVGVHAGTLMQRDPIQVQHDWSTDVAGIRLGSTGTLGGLFASSKLEARTVAEQRRLLYVGMTRAKERLILSGALTGRSSTGNFLSLLKDAVGEAVGSRDATELSVGEGRLTQVILPADEGRPRERAVKERAPRSFGELQDFEARRRSRAERWVQCRDRPTFLTPSMLEGPLQGPTGASFPVFAAAVGSLVHKALENWNYRDEVEVMLEQFVQGIGRWIPEEFRGRSAEIIKEVRDVLKAFARSEACAELRDATILGREVPFMMPWQPPPAMAGVGGAPRVPVARANATGDGPPPTLMEGRIDLLYEKDGGLWVADYKTDRIAEAEVAGRMDTYRPQAKAYTEAVRQAIGRTPAGFKLIFLRLGKGIPVAL